MKDITGFKDITATGDITGANITTILTNIGDRAQELIDAGLDAVFPFTASSPCDTVWATLLFTWSRLIQLNTSLDAIDSTYSDGNNSNIGIGIQNDNATEKLHVVGNIQADGNIQANDGNIQANNIKSFYQTANFQKNRRGFETKMGFTLKSIPGASTKIQSTNGRVRVFDLELIREHYNIFPDEPMIEDDPE